MTKVVAMGGAEYEVHDGWEVVADNIYGVHVGRAEGPMVCGHEKGWFFRMRGRQVDISEMKARLIMASDPAEVEAWQATCKW